MSCAVKGCKNCRRFSTPSSTPNISYHRFPRSDDLQKKWLKVLGIDEKKWTWSRNKVVCSIHFKEQDFFVTSGRRSLRPNTVPCLKLGHTLVQHSTPTTSAESTLSSSYGALASTSKSTIKESSSSSPLTEVTEVRLQRRRKRKLELSQSSQKTTGGETTSTDSSTKRKRIMVIKSTHNYSTSPSIIARKYAELKKRHEAYRKKLYSANRSITTLKKKVTDMKIVLDYLQKNQNISQNAVDHLEKTIDSVPRLLMMRCLKNLRNESISHESYPPILRQFAATLQFYSGKAYEVVRKEFQMALPHQATIRKWYKNIECEPGFITTAFDALKIKVDESKLLNRRVICSLMLDEISLKKQLQFDGKEMWGYVNIGIPIDNDAMQAATEALVLMVVSHQSHWKIPIAYFFITGMSGREKAHIVQECLIRLHEVGVVITSLTSDGPVTNFTMMKELGCNFDNITSMKTDFPHPSDDSQNIYCILDACHMIKLARNNFATLQVFLDPEGNPVKWEFIKKLHELQETEGLNIANKLKRYHMEWHRQKMKVNLAAQTLSKSVADAIEFLDKKMWVPDFLGSTATVEFIRRIDHLFDILNSRSPQAKGFKSPLRESTEDHWRPFVIETIQYLSRCTDVSKRPLWMTPKKTPFIGFCITAISICGIFDSYVKTKELNYLLTYKVSQDHLEVFFCSVRSRNGWNTNPTCLQFARTFRRLLLHTKISQKGGNCQVLDSTSVLHVSSNTTKNESIPVDLSVLRKFNFSPQDHQIDHDYDMIPHYIDINMVSLNIVVYISGYVLRSLKKSMKCPDCLLACEASEPQDSIMYSLISFKNRGGLNIPSYGVIQICKRIEQAIRTLLKNTSNKIPNEKNFLNIFVIANAQYFYEKVENLFPSCAEHFLESPPQDENHSFILIKNIIRIYCKIRIHNLAKKITQTIQGPAVRRQLNKLIIFNHQ